MKRLIMWWRRRGAYRGGKHWCSVCAGFESAVWELQERGYATTTTEEEYRLHRLHTHPASHGHAGPQPLTSTRDASTTMRRDARAALDARRR